MLHPDDGPTAPAHQVRQRGDPYAERAAWTRTHRALLLVVVLLGVAGRLAYVGRPLDYRVVNPWRQADYTQIARNFYREGMDILHPRIDWRGDTPGFAEMELPLLPWVGAAFYRVVGPYEQILRVLAALFASVNVLLFAALARRLLPVEGALFATAVFALNPLLLVLATSIQPEPVMECFALLAVLLLWRWSERPSFARLLASALAAALAILAKLPALCLGVLMAYLVLRRRGLRALIDPQVYLAAAVALLPPVAWYGWVHQFWLHYGLSLGVSNESHFIGWDMLAPPTFLVGILQWETVCAFTPLGWLLAAAALKQPRQRWEPLLVWYGAVLLFYVLAGRTTADRWAYYYHMLSVPPAALLAGAGFAALRQGGVLPRQLVRLVGNEARLAVIVGVGMLLLLLAGAAVLIVRRDYGHADLRVMRRCVREFARLVPPDGRIVVRGGLMYDEYGRPVAHNESMAFAWMDRKGFNYGDEELGIDTLTRIAARGGRYWVVHQRELDPPLRAAAAHRLQRLADCEGTYELYDLSPLRSS